MNSDVTVKAARQSGVAPAKASAANLKRSVELHRKLGATEYDALVARAELMLAQQLPEERIAALVNDVIKSAGLELSVGVVVVNNGPNPS